MNPIMGISSQGSLYTLKNLLDFLSMIICVVLRTKLSNIIFLIIYVSILVAEAVDIIGL